MSSHGYPFLDALSGFRKRQGSKRLCARPVSLEKRRELALAAFEVVRERGAHNVTMSDLASALGMKRPTLYWYFRDLGHVFDTVFEHVLERQREVVIANVAHVAHPIDQIVAYGDAMEAYFEREGPTLVSLIAFWGVAEGDQPNRVIETAMKSFQPVRLLAVERLRQGIREGTVEPCDPEGVIDLVAIAIDGFLLHRIARGLRWADVRKILWDRVLSPLKRGP